MSALRPEADVRGARRHVCFGPIGDFLPMALKVSARLPEPSVAGLRDRWPSRTSLVRLRRAWPRRAGH